MNKNRDTDKFHFIHPFPTKMFGEMVLACNLEISGVAYKTALEEGGYVVDFDFDEILHTDRKGRTSDYLEFMNAQISNGKLDEDFLCEVTRAHIEKHCFQGQAEPEHTDHIQDREAA